MPLTNSSPRRRDSKIKSPRVTPISQSLILRMVNWRLKMMQRSRRSMTWRPRPLLERTSWTTNSQLKRRFSLKLNKNAKPSTMTWTSLKMILHSTIPSCKTSSQSFKRSLLISKIPMQPKSSNWRISMPLRSLPSKTRSIVIRNKSKIFKMRLPVSMVKSLTEMLLMMLRSRILTTKSLKPKIFSLPNRRTSKT